MPKLSSIDIAAIKSSAKRLGLDPYSFGAILDQESGYRPNVWGGAGGNYYGLIQFGGPERKEVGLDPKKIENLNYTIPGQLPFVEKFLLGRGFKPGMSAQEAYATILGGNPKANIDAADSFGTTVRSATSKLLPGGSLYEISRQLLGEQNIDDPTTLDNTPTNINIFNVTPSVESKEKPEETFADKLKQNLIRRELSKIGKTRSNDAVFEAALDPLMGNGIGSGYLNPMNVLSGYINQNIVY